MSLLARNAFLLVLLGFFFLLGEENEPESTVTTKPPTPNDIFEAYRKDNSYDWKPHCAAEKTAVDLAMRLLCNYLKYEKTKDHHEFIKTSLKEKEHLHHMDDVAGTNLMFSARYYHAITNCVVQGNKDALSLLFFIMERTDGYYSTNSGGALAFLLYEHPAIVIKNIKAIGDFSKKFDWSLDSSVCVDEKFDGMLAKYKKVCAAKTPASCKTKEYDIFSILKKFCK